MKHASCPPSPCSLLLGAAARRSPSVRRIADDYADVNAAAAPGQAGRGARKADRLPRRQAADPQMRFLRGVILTEQGKQRRRDRRLSRSSRRTTPSCPSPTTTWRRCTPRQSQFDKARAALEDGDRAQPELRARAREPRRRLCQARGQAYGQAQQLEPAHTAAAEARAGRASSSDAAPAQPAGRVSAAGRRPSNRVDADSASHRPSRSSRRTDARVLSKLSRFRRRPAATAWPRRARVGRRPGVKLATSAGDIVVELYADKAPKTVENFLQYVKDRHYDGTVFHRVIDELHGPGRRLHGRPEAEADARADPAREPATA